MGPAIAAARAQRHEPWTCKGCNTVCTSKNACTTCGMRRSWADAARAAVQAPPPALPSAGQGTRAKLDELTAQLTSMAVVPPSPPAAPATPVAPLPAAAVAPPPAAEPGGTPDRKAISAKITSFEAALAAVPPDEVEMAAMLRTKIQEQKNLLTQAKPLGARHDAAKAALARAQQRQAEAESAMAAAQQLHANTLVEVSTLQSELRDLERQLAQAPSEDSPMPEAEPGAASTPPMTQVHTLLTKALTELSSDEYVIPEHVEAAKVHIQTLYDGFQKTAAAAKQARVAAAAAAKGTETTVRCSTKQHPPVPTVAAMIRHYGKQAPKGTIDCYFKKAKKTTLVDGKSVVFQHAPGVRSPA